MATRHHDRGILIIAVFKLIRATLLVLAGVGALASMHHDLGAILRRLLHAVNVDPHHRLFDALFQKLAGVTPKELAWVSLGTFVYAAVFATEGFALFTEKPWAEWLTVGVTTSFLPLEIYELAHHFDALRLLTVLLNVAAIVYLLVRIRSAKSKRATASLAFG